MSRRVVAGAAAIALGFIVTVASPLIAAERHRTTVSLKLGGSIIAHGEVRAADGTRACEARREVVIQRRGPGGGWQTVKTGNARPTGIYRIRIPNEDGSYRALIRELHLDGETCTRDVSPVVSHGGGGGGGDNCTPGYSPCLVWHGGADYDCYGGSGDGPYYTEPGVVYAVTGSDPYGLDGDNDGRGCE
jgi:hypothetical protein